MTICRTQVEIKMTYTNGLRIVASKTFITNNYYCLIYLVKITVAVINLAVGVCSSVGD